MTEVEGGAETQAVSQARRLRRTLMGFIVSQAIVALTELGVPDRLADGPATAAELAGAVGVDPDALRRFMRALVAEGIFAEDARGRFALTAMGSLLRGDVPGSLRDFATLMTAEAYHAWGDAGYSVRTGQPAFDHVFGMPMFDWLARDRHASARFNAAQAGLAVGRMSPLAERSWATASTVVDVGGGNGTLLSVLLGRHQRLNGILFDLPHVAKEAELALSSAGLADRVRCIGGDFCVEVPPGGDVYILAQILHDWDDHKAALILRNCHQALPPDGRLLILELIVPEDPGPHPAKLLDLHMMVMLGGRERTMTEWRELLESNNFAITDITHHARSSMIEARPA
ncbi:MAG TPA: methyltransferase [Streptosporangiaceae bacterium]